MKITSNQVFWQLLTWKPCIKFKKNKKNTWRLISKPRSEVFDKNAINYLWLIIKLCGKYQKLIIKNIYFSTKYFCGTTKIFYRLLCILWANKENAASWIDFHLINLNSLAHFHLFFILFLEVYQATMMGLSSSLGIIFWYKGDFLNR